MTKKQPTMPIINRDELYAALYTNLDTCNNDDEKNEQRTKTLKTLLGVCNHEQLESILNEYNKIQKARNELGNEDANETNTTLDKIADYWQAIHDLYVCYLEALETKYEGTPINKILIYEAPPMPYATDIKKHPNRKGKINYILAESCKVCKKSENCNDNFQIHPSGPYVDTIKGLVEGPTTKTIQDILVDQGILFIDLCPLPLPMTTDIRKSVWGAWNENIETPPLSVVLLEFALEFALKKGIQISKKPIIAMGTPSATSQSIYLYFEKKKWSGSCFKKPNDLVINGHVINFSQLLKTNEKYVEKGQILPLYASNIISGSNTPNAELLKRIF